jgi:flagellar protein FlaG
MSSVSAVGLSRVGPAERVGRTEPAGQAVDQDATPAVVVAPVVDVPLRDLKAASAEIERFVRSAGRSLQFRVDDDSGRVVVSVRDAETGELIRQIPSDAALRIAKSIQQEQAVVDSLLVEERA